jgi:hypothetical protein
MEVSGHLDLPTVLPPPGKRKVRYGVELANLGETLKYA